MFPFELVMPGTHVHYRSPESVAWHGADVGPKRDVSWPSHHLPLLWRMRFAWWNSPSFVHLSAGRDCWQPTACLHPRHTGAGKQTRVSFVPASPTCTLCCFWRLRCCFTWPAALETLAFLPFFSLMRFCLARTHARRMANAVNLDAGEVLLHSGHLMDSVKPPDGDKQQVRG